MQNNVPITPDTVYKALRLVPEFDGNPHTLIRFLSICDKLVEEYGSTEPGLINISLLNGILNKITGPAARTLANNGIPNDWSGIRTSIINNFSDHRDETSLYTDLSSLTQGADTPHIFYEKCQNMLCTIITYIQLHETIPTTIESKRELYKSLTLKTFLSGLHEPLGSRIRCMRPPTLQKALEYTQEELNTMYLQQKHIPFKNPSLTYTPPQPHYNPQISQAPTNNLYNGFPLPYSQLQQGINNTNKIMPQQNTNIQQYNTHKQGAIRTPIQAGPSRTAQMFAALPRPDMTTGFRMPMRRPQQNYTPKFKPFPSPQPMSGISHPVARTLPPTRQNLYKETNVNELHNQEGYYPEYDEENDYQAEYQYQNSMENGNIEETEQNFYQEPQIIEPE